MRITLQPAVVLHRRPYRDTSLLVEALTRDHGRIGLVGRGMRGASNRRRGLLRPFLPVLLSWSGTGDLYTLTGAEETGQALDPPPRRLLSGLYLNELLYRLLTRHDPQPELFQRYLAALAALASGLDEETVLRVFEKYLLAILGYGLLLDREADDGFPIDPHRGYHYALDHGPRREPLADSLPIAGRSLLALADEVDLIDPEIRREVKRLTRAAIARQLDGRTLQTRELAKARRAPHENRE